MEPLAGRAFRRRLIALLLLPGLACTGGRVPVIEAPASGSSDGTLALLVSGDGGWVAIDRELTAQLRSRGVSVLGVSAPRYLWTPRTADSTAQALASLIRQYLVDWRLQRVVLIGYSRGAVIVPFVATRLPADLRPRLAMVALLGPEPMASFEFHLIDLVTDQTRPGDLPVVPELTRLEPRLIVCVRGAAESSPVCPQARALGATELVMPDGHHFGGRFADLAHLLIDELARRRSP